MKNGKKKIKMTKKTEVIEQCFQKYEDSRKPIDRPNWDQYFLAMALLVSRRSPDGQTKHATVLVDEHNRIISTGYNGFLKGMPDDVLPNLRPAKYPFFPHGELNAIANLTTKNYQSLTAYVTGRPCLTCFHQLHQNNVKRLVYMASRSGVKNYCWSNHEAENKEVEALETQMVLSGMQIDVLELDLKIFEDILLEERGQKL